MSLRKEFLSCCLAAAVALSTALTPIVANAATTDTTNPVTRIGGYDRYETAALMAQKGWTGTSDNVILSAGMDYNMVDALAAGPLAAKLNAPIILTDGSQSLNSFAKAELQRLKPKKAYITSGTAVIKSAVIEELKAMGITPVPLGGYDQYETSVNIAKELANQGVDITKVVLTGGWISPVDALSVSSIAAANEMPILTTTKSQLPASVKTYLDSIKANITDSFVIGGTAVVDDAVIHQLPGKVSRYAGLTKYDTNVEVLKNFAKEYKNDTVFVANGETLVDALAGVPLAAASHSPVVLVSQQIDNTTREFVKLNMSIDDMVVLGGEAVVSTAGVNALTTVVSYASDNATVGSTDAANPLVLTDNVKITGNNVIMKNAAADYSVYVKGNNITLNNLTVKGTVFVDPGKTGSATLDGVTAGNIVILSGAPHSVIVTRSTVTGEITISSDGNTNVVFNTVTTNGVTVQTYEIYETDEQGNQVKVGTITITNEAGNNLGALTITSEPGQSTEVNLSGEFSQPIDVEGKGEVTINAAAGTVISSITTSTNNLTLGGAGTYTEVIAQSGTLTAAQGTVLPSVIVDEATATQTVTLAGNITNVTQIQGNVTLAAGTKVTNMTTTSDCTVIVPPGSSIVNFESTGPAPLVGGGGTVEGVTTPVTPGTLPDSGTGSGGSGSGSGSGASASISSTEPPALLEAGDGSLKSGIVIIEIANGTFAEGIAKADITAANLPAGMDFTVERTSPIRLTINIIGSATNHASTNSVDNLTFTIAKVKVIGATSDLTSSPIKIIFEDFYDRFIDKIMEVYGSLSVTDKTALQNARAALQAIELTDARWDSIINPLLTPQVVALYNEDEAAAKAALIEFVKDFGTLQYSADRSTLEANLDTFRSNNRDTFRTLFGNDFTMEQFFSYLIAVQEALPGVINDSDVDLIEFSGESNTKIKEQIIEWTKTAADQVASTDPYTVFATKLSALSLNVDELVETQRRLGAIIDPTNAAEKAITLAAIRSQITCTIPATMTVGEEIGVTLSVTGIDPGAIELANLLDWNSSDETVAEITTNDSGTRIIRALKAGTTIITAYKKGSTPGTSNYVVHIEITVQ